MRVVAATLGALACAGVLLAATARADPCDLLGGDPDGDGVCSDGGGSGVAGDEPCSCLPESPPSCARGCDDSCPLAWNPDQIDSGGVGEIPADGRGDACQCGDVNGDGSADILDAAIYWREALLLPPGFSQPQKCDVAGSAVCDANDLAALRDALAELAPGISYQCPSADGCSFSADCAPGWSCAVVDGVCLLNDGAACAAGAECIAGACCSSLCTDLLTEVDDCGGCGIACTNAHGTTDCTAGICTPSCSALWGNCDGNLVNGCETTLSTNTNCGACGSACVLPNATESCSTGTCTVVSCDDGFANCDAVHSNGCERPMDTCGGGCCSTAGAGSYQADNAGCVTRTTRTGTGEQCFTAVLREDLFPYCGPTEGLLQLDVPAGSDFDLYVAVSGGATCSHWNGTDWVSGCSGINASGQSEYVWIAREDTCFLGMDPTDETMTVTAEVRWYSGSTCESWALTILSGGGC